MTDLDASLNAVNFIDRHFEMGRYFDELIPNEKDTLVDIPRVHGYEELLSKFLPRKIPIFGILYASSSAQLITRIETFKEFLHHDDSVQLIFNDKSDRYYSVKYKGKVELKKRGKFVPLKLNFTAYDPFGYAVTPDNNDENSIIIDGYTWTETNNGGYYTFPVITITFNQSQAHIYLRNTSIDGCRFDISKSFVTNDELEVYGKDMSVRLNDVNSPAGFGDGGDGAGEFPLLRKGENIMEVGTDDGSLDIDVNVNYRKVYL